MKRKTKHNQAKHKQNIKQNKRHVSPVVYHTYGEGTPPQKKTPDNKNLYSPKKPVTNKNLSR